MSDFPDDETHMDSNPEPAYESTFKRSGDEAPATPPVEIPLDALSRDALAGIIENYILREGTDYGTQEVGYDSKVERVEKQLSKGEIKIVFDPDSESVTLMTAREWERATRS